LIVKLSSLGDIIHCLPILNALKSGFPEAMIDWLVEEQNAGILEGHPHIDHLIILPRKSWMKKPWHIGKVCSEIRAFMRDLRSREYDIIIDFQGLFRSGLLVGLSKGSRKIGFDRVREMAHLFYNEKVPLSTMNQHAVTRYLEIPRYLGVKKHLPQFFLPVSKKDSEYVNKILEEINNITYKNNKIIIINPNARWPSKIWPWDRFRELIKELSFKDYEVILIGSTGDKVRMDLAFNSLGDRVHNLAGKTSLKCLASLFKRGDCLITNDSGPMHLAVAVGLPVIALFGPSNPLRTGPFGWLNGNQKNRVLSSPLLCAPCYKRKCIDKLCMWEISVGQVLNALEELLSQGYW
jgi:3-deoxy-D-manno-octulosonic-acid transferase/heptosyltransferase-1